MQHVIASALLGLVTVSAHAALNAYVTITGPNGESKGHANVECHWQCAAVTEVERKTGQLQTAHRTWKPFVVTEKDASASALLQSLGNAKGPYKIKLVVMETTGTNSTAHLTLTFSGAMLSKVETVEGKAGTKSSFTFQFSKITWTWNDGGKTYNDDWSSLTF